ncbi:MAG: hypothetical protein FWB79_03400, partial [Treponema sp.]|nr:hypothetical protein [Treponema sp.]
FEGLRNYLRGKMDDALFDKVFNRLGNEAELLLTEITLPASVENIDWAFDTIWGEYNPGGFLFWRLIRKSVIL